jgi:hypothetical protein
MIKEARAIGKRIGIPAPNIKVMKQIFIIVEYL